MQLTSFSWCTCHSSNPYHLGEDAERLLKSRVRIINVWRPIRHPVPHKPLAVSDWRYLDQEKDLVPQRLIYPHRVGSIFSVRYNPVVLPVESDSRRSHVHQVLRLGGGQGALNGPRPSTC
ncbi:hypothetical protein A0H81_10070 [Grifola frondosa]|uniref:Uncharacterized protein n=1 Tax=Grifola frondosa TaxID=5627 RepID=A0A1C7LYB8_GRIFR|nr:hypothetical protein A0H81_10070 [Grifola frondosa]